MPIYEYTCSVGHRSTLRKSYNDMEVGCFCGRIAARAEVNRVNFAFAGKSEKLEHYLEASQTAEYLQSQTDDPALKPAEDIWFPAKKRAEARLLAGEQEWSAYAK